MIMLTKKDKVKKIGGIITGLGMIFVGLSVMTSSMDIFSESDKISAFLTKVSNPALLLLFGILFTALIQSSSAVSGIVVTMSVAGLLSFDQGLYIIWEAISERVLRRLSRRSAQVRTRVAPP